MNMEIIRGTDSQRSKDLIQMKDLAEFLNSFNTT